MIPDNYKTYAPLPRAFFERDTVMVARDLIGKKFTVKQLEMPAKAGIHRPLPSQGFRYKEISGIITETEAYVGQDDPACHAARGKTPRNAPMFDKAGTSYVYLIYGMYHCLNFVTENEGYPAAVLLRGVWLDPDQGEEQNQSEANVALRNNKKQNQSEAKVALRNNKRQNQSGANVALRHVNGPGKLCKALGITREHTGLDMFAPPSPFVFHDTDITLPIAETPRIGIKHGTDKLWRFVMAP